MSTLYHTTPSTILPAYNDEYIAPSKQMRCFRICEESKVESYLSERLKLLQQQANKKIAKAWIKGICPKKQSNFPYQNKHRLNESGLDPKIPKWWPPINVCPYTEPDHINKAERVALCVHLLRLRPTAQQLRSWNPGFEDRDQILQTHGWTAFLRTFTPPEILREVDPGLESQHRFEDRRHILESMYHVAQREEDFRNGACDADDMIQWEDGESSIRFLKRKQVGSKRSRQISSDSSDAHGSRASDTSVCSSPKKIKEDPDRKVSARNSVLRTKANKHKPIRSTSSRNKVPCDQVHRTSTARRQQGALSRSGSSVADAEDSVYSNDFRANLGWSNLRGNHASFPSDLQIPHPLGFSPDATSQYHDVNYVPGSDTSSRLTSSLGSCHLGQDLISDPYQMPDYPPALFSEQDFKFHQPLDGHHTVQVHHVMDVPQPQFDTTPNTPILTTASMMHFANTQSATNFNTAYDMPEFSCDMPTSQYPTAETFAPVMNPSVTCNVDHRALNQFVPSAPLSQAPPVHQSQPSCYNCPCVEYPDTLPHGLPTLYHPRYETPQGDGPPPPFIYSEFKPEANFPAAPLPGRVVRGFTGHGSGVGGGAMV